MLRVLSDWWLLKEDSAPWSNLLSSSSSPFIKGAFPDTSPLEAGVNPTTQASELPL
jgi:hypothetical protein